MHGTSSAVAAGQDAAQGDWRMEGVILDTMSHSDQGVTTDHH